ncbi:Late transcription factor VLTF-4 (1), partial [Monkeypox virus]
QAAGISRQFTS